MSFFSSRRFVFGVLRACCWVWNGGGGGGGAREEGGRQLGCWRSLGDGLVRGRGGGGGSVLELLVFFWVKWLVGWLGRWSWRVCGVAASEG